MLSVSAKAFILKPVTGSHRILCQLTLWDVYKPSFAKVLRTSVRCEPRVSSVNAWRCTLCAEDLRVRSEAGGRVGDLHWPETSGPTSCCRLERVRGIKGRLGFVCAVTLDHWSCWRPLLKVNSAKTKPQTDRCVPRSAPCFPPCRVRSNSPLKCTFYLTDAWLQVCISIRACCAWAKDPFHTRPRITLNTNKGSRHHVWLHLNWFVCGKMATWASVCLDGDRIWLICASTRVSWQSHSYSLVIRS